MTRYLPAYRPPIPSLLVQLALPDEAPLIGPLAALVDTGADATLIPAEYLERLGAEPIYQSRLRAVFGPPRLVNVFLLDLVVEQQRLPGINVVAWQAGTEIILGPRRVE